MISRLLMWMRGVWMRMPLPSVPALVPRSAMRVKAAMNSGRQSG